MLNDEDDEGLLPEAVSSNVISFCGARLNITRHLVSLIDGRHRVARRYPVLAILAKSYGWEPDALGLAYLRYLRRDLEAVSEPRTGLKQCSGSVVALRIVEGHSEGP